MNLSTERLEGKYEILGKLGEGGMGTVYKVRHLLLDELRVIKVLRPALEDDEEFQARFEREARVASKLRHPNIAQIYDFSVDEDGSAHIVLEFIEGSTLDEILRASGPPPLDLALEIARQSLAAIGYLHRRSFVHRDISPDNLMLSWDLDGRPLVKLIDLGITKVLEGDSRLTATGMFLGKVHYTSPEALGEEAETLDGRSDLYSFGVVLYEMLTGRKPIEGDSPHSVIAGHLVRPPVEFERSDPKGKIPAELRAIVMKALAKNRDQRIQSAEAFSEELTALQARWSCEAEVPGQEPADRDVRVEVGGRDFDDAPTVEMATRQNPGPARVDVTERIPDPPALQNFAGVEQAAHLPSRPAQKPPARRRSMVPLVATAVLLGGFVGWMATGFGGGDPAPPPPPPVNAAGAYEKSFEEGFRAAAKQDWNDVLRHMSAAIADRPQAGGTVRIDGHVETYLPYFYRGKALYELGKYREAAVALQSSERHDQVTGGRRAELQRMLQECLEQYYPSSP